MCRTKGEPTILVHTMHESLLKPDIPRKITKQAVLRTIKKSVAEFSHSLTS